MVTARGSVPVPRAVTGDTPAGGARSRSDGGGRLDLVGARPRAGRRRAARLLADLTDWARSAPGVHALAVVGSCAGGALRMADDLDVIVLSDHPGRSSTASGWSARLPPGARLVRTACWTTRTPRSATRLLRWTQQPAPASSTGSRRREMATLLRRAAGLERAVPDSDEEGGRPGSPAGVGGVLGQGEPASGAVEGQEDVLRLDPHHLPRRDPRTPGTRSAPSPATTAPPSSTRGCGTPAACRSAAAVLSCQDLRRSPGPGSASPDVVSRSWDLLP